MAEYRKPAGGMISPKVQRPSVTDVEEIVDEELDINDLVLNNFTATTDPTTNDDTGEGYEIGSIWINTTNTTRYWVCMDPSTGVALWRPQYFNASVRVTNGDTNPESLRNKLDDATDITFTTVNPGANESLSPELSNTGVTAGDYKAADITVDAKGRITAASDGTPSWQPPSIELGAAQTSGTTIFNAPAGGFVETTPEGSSLRFNVDLEDDGASYDGSDIGVYLLYQLFNAPGVNDEVRIDLTSIIVSDGDDNYNGGASVTTNTQWVVGGINAREQQEQLLDTISGASGAKNLQVTIERFNLGPAIDYTGDFDVYGIVLKKM